MTGGAPGAEAGADGCHHGNSEPDWEAGADAGAGGGAGAKLPEEGDGAAELWRVRHCARNCGQVWPLVVPAAWACFHSLAHVLITLWAFAAVGPPKASPKTIAAAVSKEPSELRISFPKPHPGMGAALAYREPDRSAKRIPRTALTVAQVGTALAPPTCRLLRRRQFA